MQMKTVRIFFSKTSRAKYISHLDTMRTLTRALKRSGLPLWYTEGYNPHLYLTFALPISLGYESLCESFDVRLTGEVDREALVKKLNGCFPPGFRALEAAEPVMEPKAIAWGEYEITLRYGGGGARAARGPLETLLRQPVITVVKRTKKGEREVDIRPLLELLKLEEEPGLLRLTMRFAAGLTTNINPTLFLKEFYRWANEEPDGVRIVRTALLDEKLERFR